MANTSIEITVANTITAVFQAAFQSHPQRHSDPALALDSARETASEAVPAGVTGSFDDELLTFTTDPISDPALAAIEKSEATHALIHEDWSSLSMDEVIARVARHRSMA